MAKEELISLEHTPIVINPGGAQASFTLREDRYVSVADLAKAYEEKRRLVIVDARTPSDFLRLHITGAISIPYFDMRGIDHVPNDGTWVVAYCACPHHVSGIVMEELRKRGYAQQRRARRRRLRLAAPRTSHRRCSGAVAHRGTARQSGQRTAFTRACCSCARVETPDDYGVSAAARSLTVSSENVASLGAGMPVWIELRERFDRKGQRFLTAPGDGFGRGELFDRDDVGGDGRRVWGAHTGRA